jgi:hypothetical protein
MNEREVKRGAHHSTMGILFEYEEKSAVPVWVQDDANNPFTGYASESIGAADWSGQFIDGLPHGEFIVVWADRMTIRIRFDHGRQIAK